MLLRYGYELAAAVLLSFGLIGIFNKCGTKKIYAFIPFYRIYKLTQCADMGNEGKKCIAVQILCLILALAAAVTYRMIDIQSVDMRILIGVMLVLFAVDVISLIIELRIYLGLCRVFKMRKRWVLLMLIALWLPMLIWGYSASIQPDEEYLKRLHPAKLSNKEAAVLESGLTVNIKDRTVGGFFNRKCLLRDVHMSIKPGSMVMLIGGSGAGKTTLVNAITGYEKAVARVTLNSKDVYKHFDEMKYEIGFVPQQELMRKNDTVYRTVADASALRLPVSIDSNERDKRVDNVLEALGLAAVKGNIVGQQSGGQKKRISIAMELISDPMLFVLDEPDSGLDGVLAKDLMQRLHDISREGRIVIVITHTPDRVIDLFDDVIVLAKDAQRTGRLAFYGSIAEAKEFFGKDSMEGIIKTVNRPEEGGEGRADELIEKFAEVCSA